MTDTEAKALEIELRKVAAGFYSEPDVFQTARFAADHIEATEARHAAELREQAERFDAFRQEVSDAIKSCMLGPIAEERLAPFILHAPDPLVEVIADVRPWDTNHQWNNAAFSKRLAAAIEARGGKIVWEAGE